MDLYERREPTMRERRKQPLGYTCFLNGHRPLWVAGHYETPCGGCDTINGVDYVYQLLYEAIARDEDVLYEGLIIASDVARAIELKEFDGMVIELDVPIVDCLASVMMRRNERGDDRELNPTNTMRKAKQVASQRVRFMDSGIDFRLLNREDAFIAIVNKLGLAERAF
jgi:hypothetical protein